MADFGDHIAKFFSKCEWQSISNCNGSTANHNNRLELVEKSLNSLSEEEKEKLQQKLYGGETPIDESTEFVNEKLEELRREVDKLTVGFKKTYMEAIQKEEEQIARESSRTGGTHPTKDEKDRLGDKDDDKVDTRNEKSGINNNLGSKKRYVTSREFLLKFLRSERFDTRLSARRLGRYFKEKLTLFGKEKLTCRIKQSDLSGADLSALRSGRFVIPGVTDASGRLIVLGSRYYGDDDLEKCVNMKRAQFYLFESWLEDHEEAQKNGFVFVAWSISPSGEYRSTSRTKMNANHYPVIRMMNQVMPVRFEAIHLCYSDLKEHVIFNLICLTLPTHIRRITVCHYGAPSVCMLEMIRYGIDADALPLSEDGNFKCEKLIVYVEELEKKDVDRNA